MIIQIPLTNKSLLKSLADQPETGMGYQDVYVTLKDGSVVEATVFNGNILRGSILSGNERNIRAITVKSSEAGQQMRPTDEYIIQ